MCMVFTSRQENQLLFILQIYLVICFSRFPFFPIVQTNIQYWETYALHKFSAEVQGWDKISSPRLPHLRMTASIPGVACMCEMPNYEPEKHRRASKSLESPTFLVGGSNWEELILSCLGNRDQRLPGGHRRTCWALHTSSSKASRALTSPTLVQQMAN